MSTGIIEHQHRFPCQPPGGTILKPGSCECGTTYRQAEASKAFANAAALVADAYPLPAGDYLTGVAGDWHAVAHADAGQTAKWFGREVTYAVCGKLTRLSLRHPAYDPGSRPVSFQPCAECMWIVASARGELAAEVERLMPGNEDREILARLIPDPLIAVTAAAMIVEAATAGRDGATLDDPATIQLLAAISRHAPAILVPEDCAEGSCEHYPPGYDPLSGKGFECSRPQASAACAACSLQAGPWAGEWEGTFRYECKVPAPCAPLLALAEHATEALAEAKRDAAAAADWEREQAAGAIS
jgi:hypothetical protein